MHQYASFTGPQFTRYCHSNKVFKLYDTFYIVFYHLPSFVTNFPYAHVPIPRYSTKTILMRYRLYLEFNFLILTMRISDSYGHICKNDYICTKLNI